MLSKHRCVKSTPRPVKEGCDSLHRSVLVIGWHRILIQDTGSDSSLNGKRRETLCSDRPTGERLVADFGMQSLSRIVVRHGGLGDRSEDVSYADDSFAVSVRGEGSFPSRIIGAGGEVVFLRAAGLRRIHDFVRCRW